MFPIHLPALRYLAVHYPVITYDSLKLYFDTRNNNSTATSTCRPKAFHARPAPTASERYRYKFHLSYG